MKRKAGFILGLALSVVFIFGAMQPALGAEKTVVLKITGCG